MSNETLLKTTGSSKTCPKCGDTKPLTEFHKDKSRKDGRQSRCKPCQREKARENSRRWREANPEKNREKARRWCEANPEKARERSRRWREANPDKAHAHDQEKLAKRSRRVARIRTLMAHFEGRVGWLENLAAVVATRSDAQGLQWLASDIDELVLTHYYKEA